MNNLALFINGFCDYLIVYFVFIAAIVVAFLIGIAWRKSKNKALLAENEEMSVADSSNEAASAE